MKKTTISAIAAVSVAGALVVGLGAVSSGFKNWDTSTWFGRGGSSSVVSGTAIEDENFILTPNESDGVVALSVKPRNSANSKVAYPSYTITAAVSGNISNPKIDWTIETLDGFTSSATNPVTVTPTSDGSLTATITCNAAFSGGLNVVATLRDVGSYATCSVVFEGIPSELNMSIPSLTKNGDYYEVSKTGTYSATANLDNVFHSVGDKYGRYTVTATAHGKVTFAGFTQNSMLPGAILPAGSETLNLSDLSADRLMAFSVSGNTITIKVNGALSSYVYSKVVDGSGAGMGSSSATYKYSSVAEKCYYEIKVVDTVSGLYTTFNVTWGEALLTTVSVSQGTVTF